MRQTDTPCGESLGIEFIQGYCEGIRVTGYEGKR